MPWSLQCADRPHGAVKEERYGTTTGEDLAPPTKGRVLHSEARYYDILAWLLTFGRERRFRERLVELAQLKPGEVVLDVGCGTGSLAIAAKRRVGAAGSVHGVDASPEMVDRARRKTTKTGVEVAFQTAIVEALPFPDASFDVVLSTLVLHHLPSAVRQQGVREMRRVLKPEGRVLAVDFVTPAPERRGLLARLHRHGHLAVQDIVELLSEVGLRIVEIGSVGISDLQFVVATAPDVQERDQATRQSPAHRSFDPLPTPRWIVPGVGLVLIAGHGIILGGLSARLAMSAVAVTAVAGLVILMHSGLGLFLRKAFRHRRRRSS
jgi:ubiquinone/menaquinone biosynthesis C-methylase UbiE